MTTQHQYVDQMGQHIYLINVPKRIISLVPSQTELLYELNLADQVVGITRFCVHPNHWKNEKTIVGGTKKFNFDKIDALHPDLIIGNKEENYPEGIARLKKQYPVWMSDVNNYADALAMIRSVGEITNRSEQAGTLTQQIELGFDTFQKTDSPRRVLYFIWKNPWMVVGTNTFIDAMLKQIGFINCASDFTRYPVIEEDTFSELKPEVILLPSEPYPFSEKHIHQLEDQFPGTKIKLVDGEYFSWYGSRLKHAPQYFNKFISQVIG
jgi:ABC-type Fe3+-hydroxamate transport system substrate-binding protein